MKQKDLKPCHCCGKGVMHDGSPLFLRISVDRFGVDAQAVKQQHGLELMVGSSVLANIMGPDRDLAKRIDGRADMLICTTCAAKPLSAYLFLDEGAEREEAAA